MCVRQKLRWTVTIDKSYDTLGVYTYGRCLTTATGTRFYRQWLSRVHMSVLMLTRQRTRTTVCPTRYRTRHFFNNSDTNEDIATKFEQGYVSFARNEEECVCNVPNCCETEQRSASQPGWVAKGTPYIFSAKRSTTNLVIIFECLKRTVIWNYKIVSSS
jgi:hypothetical protein